MHSMRLYPNSYKQALIAVIIALISLLHYLPLQGLMATHLLHRELFFLPILMAGFFFGLKGGLITAMVVSTIYLVRFIISGNLSDVLAAAFFQILVFMAVGPFFGWMVDRQERRRRERDSINEAFGRYIPRPVRDAILGGRIPLDGEIKVVTVLFADLRNFTTLVEKMDPRTVSHVINQYFEAMTEAIDQNGGMVLQFIGDEIEAVFGAPIETEHHAQMAIQAALDMRAKLIILNRKLALQGIMKLRHGIGIHTGQVLAGNIGGPDRLSYAMVGKTVNLASRIQEKNKRYGTDILLSADTAKAVGRGYLNIVQCDIVPLKGFQYPVTLFSLPRIDID